MGKVLQIRVVAITWNEDLIEDYWPRISRLAFSVPLKLANNGVLEMVRALAEGLQFEKWPDERKKTLAPGIEECDKIRKELEQALADWDPKKANELSNQLEEGLDRLERSYK